MPAARNLTLKWDALCGQDAACRHSVDRNTAGNVHAAKVIESAAKLYKKLLHGHWWDGKKKRKINSDFSKLPLAMDLTEMERNLVKDFVFLQKKHAGTQQVLARVLASQLASQLIS